MRISDWSSDVCSSDLLVYAPIAMFWTRAIGLTVVARLLVWPSFNFRGCGQIVGFGSAVLFSQLFWLVQSQSDIFIAGARFDAHALGLYADRKSTSLHSRH